MFFFSSLKPRPLQAGAPSTLLEYVAGDFAARVAGYWPPPHGPFLVAAASRRHLVCLALALAGPGGAIDADSLLARPLKQAIRIAAPGAPDGLARALGHLGERAWAEDDYRALLRLLADRLTGKLLRHRDQITAEQIRALELLPQPLLARGLGRVGLDDQAARVIADIFAAVSARDGADAGAAVAARWAGAETLAPLADLARLDLEPEPPAPPFEGSDRLRALATKAAIIDAATRYRNCLRTRLHAVCLGESALYEWAGPPGVVLEIYRDTLLGWSLDQARLPKNEAVPEPARTEIITELHALGVHVGRSIWSYHDALDELTSTPRGVIKTEAEVIAELFGD